MSTDRASAGDGRAQRVRAVAGTLERIRRELADRVDESSLTRAMEHLLALASRTELFPREDFPLPDGDSNDRMFRLAEDDDGGYALYVNSGTMGQTTDPHDHGDTWAIVVSVEGRERHRLYQRVDDQSEPGAARLEMVREIDVEPGVGVALLPDGIHSIHALEPEPLLHLHLYGVSFERQSTRKEFDLACDSYRSFNLDDFSYIEESPR